jgi:hypothetical protein
MFESSGEGAVTVASDCCLFEASFVGEPPHAQLEGLEEQRWSVIGCLDNICHDSVIVGRVAGPVARTASDTQLRRGAWRRPAARPTPTTP